MKAPWPTERSVLRRWFWIMHLEDMPAMSQRDSLRMKRVFLGALAGLILVAVGAANAQGGDLHIGPASLTMILGVVSLCVSLLGGGVLWGKYTALAEQSSRRLDRLEDLERQIVPRDEIDRRLENIEAKLSAILSEVRR